MLLSLRLLPVLLAAQLPAPDSLRLLALRLPDSALAIEAQVRPLAVREAISEALAGAVRAPADGAQELTVARRLAAAYAAAWRDSFLIGVVARFTAWPAERRAAKVWADSVRRAGVAAFGRDGPRAAIAIWRRALARATAIHDTAGIEAVLGNIGAGFLEEGRLDSAESYLERSRTLAAASRDVRVEANAVGSLAGVSEERGDLAAARERYTRALAMRGRIGDTRGVAADHNNLGLLAQSLGDVDEARREFEAALALNRRDGRDEVAATNLVNLAGLASLAGDFARAESLYRDALATWRARAQWADAAVALHGLGQLELRRGDYPAARATFLEALAIFERTGPLPDELAVRRDLAGALAAQGELQGAVDELRRDQRLADSARVAPGVRAGIALARGDLAVQLNARDEAERLYAGAELLFRQAGDRGGEAEAQEGRGLLFLDRDDLVRAQALLGAALRAQLAAGIQRAAALARLSLGQVALARGDTSAARLQLVRSAADLERLGDPVATAAALGERAALEAAAGLPLAADSLYRAALRRLEGRVAPEVTWRLHAGLAAVLRSQGTADAAARELRSALADIERPSRSLALAERRSGFLSDKWGVYADLALLERARGRAGAAFEASERLRAREVLELLARGRVAGSADAPADLVVREQDLRRRIAELTLVLEGVRSGIEAVRGPDVSTAAGATREALVRAQETYAELLLEMKERAPRHAALVSREAVTWRDVARRLAPEDAFIEYLVSDSASLAFVVIRDSVTVLDLGVGRRDLARLVEFTRGTMATSGSLRPDSLWRGALRRLHQYLIAPIEEAGLLAGKTRLVLVPHAELHYLPFAALLGGEGRGRFLIERYELEVTPSASVWLTLGERRPARSGTGVLAFAPRPDVLPGSTQEVAAIARLGGADARVLTGAAASEDAFRREAPGRRVLHLATYGVLNKQNPLFSFVDLAPGSGQDGRLEVHEVFGLDLAADLVVLSACQTGLGSGSLADVPAGDDWVGLARAFLSAGAQHVVATLWPVEDRATAVLMERFYGAFGPGTDPAMALARAQRALLAAPTTAHPFYWAGFVAVGGAR
jgi:CHAT domain-containing protein/Tfp pilus assembly protein PilF